MKINFKKITALATSALMVGMTMGVAAAANYPAPFVSGSTADVAIVYGTGSGFSQLDLIEAGNIQTNLQSFMTGTSSASVSTSGELVSLDSSADRVWLNTSLNSVKSTLTKTDLPTVLADYTFSGNVDSKLTSTIKLITGETTTAIVSDEHTGTVLFLKQPKSSDDPIIGISMGTSQAAYPLYNASATMSAINFTHADSEGQDITLFGQTFTIASATDTTSIVLLKEAEKVSLTSDAANATVTVDGEAYTIELISASDTAATIKVTDSTGGSDSKEISEAASKKVNGITIAVQTADETNLKLSASIIAGADKLTLTNGAQATLGDEADPIDGTYVYIKGGTGAVTELAVAVFAPDTSSDALLEGSSFVDPLFGSFKFEFAGLSSPLDDVNRETIVVENAADDSMTLTMTDSDGNTKTFDFAHNTTRGSINYKPAHWTLADDSNDSIYVYEMANLSEDKYVVIGNEDYGHLLQVTQIYNYTGTDYTKDAVKFKDVFTGETYSTVFTSECVTVATGGSCGTVTIDGKAYGVQFLNSGDDGWVQLKYPTSDSGNSKTFVVYPTIKTKNGAKMFLYEPLLINMSNFNKSGTHVGDITLKFPDGDGYTDAVLTEIAGQDLNMTNWTITGAGTAYVFAGNATDSAGGVNAANKTGNITIGTLTYSFFSNVATNDNSTKLYLRDPESTAVIDQPAVVIFEGKDDNSAYHAVVIDLETAPAGTSTDGVGVNDILYSSTYYHSGDLSLPSDSDISKQIDWWGTLGTKDANDADQKTAELSYPKAQVYSQLYMGEVSAAVSATPGTSGTTQLGNVLVKDSEVSSVATKNLVVVGGSCINSAAATLVGGAKCGAAWTTATGVGAGQFLIKGYATSSLTSKLALLVAGYEAADTVNAATYLRTKAVDTGKEYKGTSSTEATLVTTTA